MKVVFAVRGDGYAAFLAERMEEAGIALVRAEPGDAFRRELADADVAICNRLEPADTEAATRLRSSRRSRRAPTASTRPPCRPAARCAISTSTRTPSPSGR